MAHFAGKEAASGKETVFRTLPASGSGTAERLRKHRGPGKGTGVSREKTESLYNDGLIRVSRVTHAGIGDRDLNCPELSRIVTCWVLITGVSG